MLYYLIYFSTATNLMSEKELSSLLDESRIWNDGHDLTGMLVYIEGAYGDFTEARFMQVLEGTRDEVQFIFRGIRTDDRHHHVTLLKEADIKERNFSEWSMKFEKVDLLSHPDLVNFFQMDKVTLESEAFGRSDFALKFLKSF